MERKRDDSVLVGIGYGGTKSTPKGGFSVEGKILNKDKHSDICKVLLILLVRINTSELWVSTEDLTPATNANRIHAEVNNSFHLYLKNDWNVSKIKTLVSLIIYLATTIFSFRHFCIFSKRLVFVSLQEVFVKKY